MTDPNHQLFVCVLQEPTHTGEVLSCFLEHKIEEVTVIDSQGMSRMLRKHMPVLASFRHLLNGSKPYHSTILAVVPDAVNAAVTSDIQEALIRAPKEERGFLFTLALTGFVNLTRGQDAEPQHPDSDAISDSVA